MLVDQNHFSNTPLVLHLCASHRPTYVLAQRVTAFRVLRERLMALLENAEDEWEKHRRPWQRHRGREAKKHLRKDRTTSRTRCKGTEECSAIHIGVRNGSLWGLPYLDSGAGPRRLWDAVAGPMFVDATWSVQPEVGNDARQRSNSRSRAGEFCKNSRS